MTVQQLTAADLTRMTPQQIVKAREAGQFHELLTGETPYPVPETGPLTDQDVKHMTPAQIVAARAAGRFDRDAE